MKTNGLSGSHTRRMAKAFKVSAAEPANAHSCHQRQYRRRLVVPLDWASAPVRYRGPWLGRRLPDYTLHRDTLVYDIVIQFFLTIRALKFPFNTPFGCKQNIHRILPQMSEYVSAVRSRRRHFHMMSTLPICIQSTVAVVKVDHETRRNSCSTIHRTQSIRIWKPPIRGQMTSRNAYATSRFSVRASAGPLLPLYCGGK